MTAVQESSVETFGAVHAKVQEGNNAQETARGASLRELQRFFEKEDSSKGYAGLRRIADEDGTAVWTLLKETEVVTQLEKRARERREEEQRHEKIFSDQARSPSGQADAVETLRAELNAARETAATEVETLRAELAAREEATEAKAHGETQMARRKAKSRDEAEMERGETESARAVTEAAQGDKHPGGCCSVL